MKNKCSIVAACLIVLVIGFILLWGVQVYSDGSIALWGLNIYTTPGPTPMFYGFNQTFGCCSLCDGFLSVDGNLSTCLGYYGEKKEIVLEEIQIFNKDSSECKVNSLGYNSTEFKLPIQLSKSQYLWIDAVDCAPKNARVDAPFELNVKILYKENVSGQMVEKTSEGTIKYVYL